jgi:beta-lactamase regulating signal transducer with metallopeptidase domain
MTAWMISASLLIVVVTGIRFLFKGRISRRLQYALWGLVLLRLLVPFSLPASPFSVMNAVPESSFTGRQVYVLPLSRQPVAATPGVSVDENGTVMDANSFGYAVLAGDGKTITRYAGKLSLGEILRLFWLGGGLACGLWFSAANVLFYRRLRQTRRFYPGAGKLPVYVSEYLASPCLFGVFRPAVYLTPKAVATEENLRYVLAHEQCHYRHGDQIWALLRGLCLAVWWWNPLVWAAAFFSREDSELACDEAVLRQVGRENRLAYGRTLVEMIAVRQAPAGLLGATTVMVSGKRGLQERLKMIVNSPQPLIPAAVAALLIVALGAGCTFTGAGKNAPAAQNAQPPASPAVEMIFSAADTDLEQLGRDAAAFYYTQFMREDVPQYWHLTQYKPLACKLMAGDQAEFAVWATSYLETDGAGFLIGQGIPSDPGDISKGGVCPEVGRQFRIKALGGGKYEIVSIGTGGGDRGLAPVLEPAPSSSSSASVSPSYALGRLKNGEVFSMLSPLAGDDAQLAQDAVMNYRLKSAAWPGIDPRTLAECYLLRATYRDGTITDYYAWVRDGNAVMQGGLNGYYSRLDNGLYKKLVRLAQEKKNLTGW